MAIAASIGLAGCGGSSDKDGGMTTNTGGSSLPAPLPTGTLALPSGHNLEEPEQGTETEFTIPANGMKTIGNVKFECKSNRACTVTIRNLLGNADATRVGEVGATLVAATDGGAPTTSAPGAGGDGIGDDGLLSRATLLKAVKAGNSNKAPIVKDKGIGTQFDDGKHNDQDSANSSHFRSMKFTRSTTSSDDEVFIYSDILRPRAASPNMVPFNAKYGNISGAEDKVSSADTDDFWGRLAINGLTDPGSGIITRTEYEQGKGIGGMFGGLAGSLTCESGDCVVKNTGGTLSATGSWSFKLSVSASSNVVLPMVPDADYLVFGYWRQTKAQVGVPYPHPTVLEAFYVGSDPFNASNVARVSGTAIYAGKAVGRYAYRRKDEATVARGQFEDTAAISLTARFGNSSDAGSISGEITGIHANNIQSVALPSTNIASTGKFSGSAPIGYEGGSWEGQFFGNTKDRPAAFPTSAAGMFEGWKGTTSELSSGDKGYTRIEGSFGTRSPL